jgi:hypothetical protein
VKLRKSVLCGVMCVACTLLSAAQTVQTKERAFTVKYKDGTVERYKVDWAASMNVEVHEDGHPAIPANFQFTDTRQCHWSISGHIDRQVALINKLGQAFAQSSLSKTYSTDFANKGSDFMVLGFRSENCNDAVDRRNSDINNAKSNLLNVFDGNVNADLAKLKREMKSNAEVVAVEFQ